MIRYFLFDCGGVLLRRQDDVVYQTWTDRLGLSVEAFSEALWEGSPWIDAELGAITEAEYWAKVGAKLGLDDPKEIERLADELWADWCLDDSVIEIVDQLKARYQIAMLSNASDVLEYKLEHQYGVADRFDPILTSAGLALAKPDPAIYKTMLKRLDAKADEVVFIDDRADNIAAAASLGIHVIWFVNAGELRRQLDCYLKAPAAAPAQQPR